MADHAVVVGGGPTGLMLAGELALAGVDVAIVERRASQDLIGSRAGGLYARAIEVLDQRGIADRFLSQGQVAQIAGFAWIPLDISDFPPIGSLGTATVAVMIDPRLEVKTIIEQVRAAGIDAGLLEQYEARLRRVEEELEKPDGQGRLQTVHDLVETANGSKELLIPTVGFLAAHAEKIKTFGEAVANLIP